MTLPFEVGFSRSESDIRDFTLIDAFTQLSRQQGIDFKFGLVNLDPSEDQSETDKTEKSKDPDERKFKLEILSSLKPNEIFYQKDIRDSVLIPLNFRYSVYDLGIMKNKGHYEGSTGKIDLTKGQLVVLDYANRKPKGFLQAGSADAPNASKIVHFVPFESTPSDSSSNGDLQIPEPKRYLIFGAGSQQFDDSASVNWSPVENQGQGMMCGASAGVALVEYFERISEGRHLDASKLFLHQAACHLLRVSPNSAVTVRAIVNALRVFGVPPEESWPYDLSKLNEEPPAWCYSQARNYRASSYLKLDRPNMTKRALLAQIKVFVYAGLPVIFGFSIHESTEQSFNKPTVQSFIDKRLTDILERLRLLKPGGESFLIDELVNLTDPPEYRLLKSEGEIPFPSFGEIYLGGHAAVIVGYDDRKIIINSNPLGRRDREQTPRVFLRNPNHKIEVDSDEIELNATKKEENLRNQYYPFVFTWDIEKQGYILDLAKTEELEDQGFFNNFKFIDDPNFTGKYIELSIVEKPKQQDNFINKAIEAIDYIVRKIVVGADKTISTADLELINKAINDADLWLKSDLLAKLIRLDALYTKRNSRENKRKQFRTQPIEMLDEEIKLLKKSIFLVCSNILNNLNNDVKVDIDNRLSDRDNIRHLVEENISTKKEETLLRPSSVTYKDLSSGRDFIAVDEHLATLGAFKIRNSWGKEWGKEGYGWLPYAYLHYDLAFDWWTILKFDWINTNEFGLLREINGNLVMCDPVIRPCKTGTNREPTT